MDFSDIFNNPLFLAVQLFLLSFISNFLPQIVAYAPVKSSSVLSKARTASFRRIRHWIKFSSRYSPSAMDMRRSYAIKLAKDGFPPDPTPPGLNLNIFGQMISMLCRFGPFILLNMVLQTKIVLETLPFEAPNLLKVLLQFDMTPELRIKYPNGVATFAFFFFTDMIMPLLIACIPMGQKKPPEIHPPNDSVKPFTNDLLIKESEWELEGIEDKFMSYVNEELQKD